MAKESRKGGMARSEETRKQALEKLERFGTDILGEINKGDPPKFEMPARTLKNVLFDEKRNFLVRGEGMASRKYINTAHTRTFMQTMLVANACIDYIKQDRTVTKRELYYNLKHNIPSINENTFDDDTESGGVINDMEAALDVVRTQLHLQAKGRGSVYGNITLAQVGHEIDCTKLGRGGWTIPGYVEDVVVKDHDAKFILAVENDAMMSRLIEEKAHEKLNCILVTGEGQFPTAVRRFIRVVQDQTKLPVYAFNDGDPYGFYIYVVLKYGSIELAHLSDRLAIPNSKFIGMTMDDIETYDLHNVTEKLDEQSRKRIRELLQYHWVKKHPEWTRQLELMEKKGVRIEQQALSNKKLEFVVTTYLPEKIENEVFLP